MSGIFDLHGQTALVTGANRGIGRAIAEGLAANGADIIAVSANIPDDGGPVGAAVRALGRQLSVHRVDFTSRAAVLELAERYAAPGAVDILVNNAGTIRRAPAAEHPLEWWDEVLTVNLSAPYLLAQTIGRGMLERGHGRIIFTASLLSFQGGINVPGYTASKSAVAGLVKALSNEWTGRGVTVNAVVPGYIDTNNTAALRADPERSADILGRIPAGRWGRPEDIAGAAVYLASPAASYTSGICLPVDGGWLGR